jgi:hypothetical protein
MTATSALKTVVAEEWMKQPRQLVMCGLGLGSKPWLGLGLGSASAEPWLVGIKFANNRIYPVNGRAPQFES